VESVRKRALDLPEQHELADGEGRLAAPRLGRATRGADDVAQVDVDLARPARVAEELDAARAVDEVEEHELAVSSAGHDTPGDAARLVGLGPGLERGGLLADGRDLDAVGKPLRQPGHRRRV
jgi:hypothetical protein